MSAPNVEILERLDACETSLEAHRGYLKAFEYGLRLAVIAHPQPHVLSTVWAQLLPGIAEKHAAEGGTVYKAALQQALTLLTDQIGASSPGPTEN